MDQGWQFYGVVKENKVYFLETDDSYPINKETTEVFCNICVDLETLQRSVTQQSKMMTELIAKLTAYLGVDVWTKYHYKENLKFGTSTWKPEKAKQKYRFISSIFGRNKG